MRNREVGGDGKRSSGSDAQASMAQAWRKLNGGENIIVAAYHRKW